MSQFLSLLEPFAITILSYRSLLPSNGYFELASGVLPNRKAPRIFSLEEHRSVLGLLLLSTSLEASQACVAAPLPSEQVSELLRWTQIILVFLIILRKPFNRSQLPW